MLRTKVVNYDNLPEDLKKKYYHNSFNSFLLIYHKNKLISAFIFAKCRDSWIPELIEKAYKLGLKDGNSLDYLDNEKEGLQDRKWWRTH
ncbi:MAG TPA: hypothetical protein ENI23_13345 [bacterium]|nr:hypothetical protein [bacterium]